MRPARARGHFSFSQSSHRGPGPRASPEISGFLNEDICSQTCCRICYEKSFLSRRPLDASPSCPPACPCAGALSQAQVESSAPGSADPLVGPSLKQQVECSCFRVVDHTDVPAVARAGGRGYKQEDDLDQDAKQLRGCQNSGALGWRVAVFFAFSMVFKTRFLIFL